MLGFFETMAEHLETPALPSGIKNSPKKNKKGKSKKRKAVAFEDFDEEFFRRCKTLKQ